MSTKTLRKRIALVAVSAMGFGLLTSVAANATTTGTLTVSSSAAGAFGNCSTVLDDSGALATVTSTSTGLTFTAPVGNRLAFTVGTASDMVKVVGQATIGIQGTGTDEVFYYGSTGRYIDDTAGKETGGIIVTPTAVGTVTLYNIGTTPTDLATAEAAVPGTGNRITINVVASCTNSTMSASKSAIVVTGDTDANDTVAAGTYGPDTLTYESGEDAYVHIQAFNEYATALPSGTWVASATNNAKVALYTSKASAIASTAAGTLSTVSTSATGTDVYVRVSRASSKVGQTTTVTLTYDGTTMVTRNITFYGEATKINIVKNTIGLVGAEGFFTYNLSDSAGNLVPGSVDIDPTTFGTRVSQLVAADGKDATIAAAAPANSASDVVLSTELGSTTDGVKVFNCLNAGGAGTQAVTVRYWQPITEAYITSALTLTCAGAASTFSASLDKSSYQKGEVGVLTISAKDASGNTASDLAYVAGAIGTTPDVASGSADNTFAKAPAAGDRFTAGAKTYKIQMSGAGSWTASVNVAGSNQTVAYKVTDSGVSNTEVLAAIVKLIASINKQIKALQKLLK